MQEFYAFAQYFVHRMTDLAGFLTQRPFAWLSTAIKYTSFTGNSQIPEDVWNMAENFSSLSLAAIVLGGALTTLVIIKAVAFITDLIT